MRYLLFFSLDSGEVVGHQVVPFAYIPEVAQGIGCWAVLDISRWERAIKISQSGLILSDGAVRNDPVAAPDRKALLQQHGHYRANRRQAYDPLPEQLDRITKALSVLAAAGIDIGEAGIEQISHCQAVKSRYPKRVL